MKGQGCLLICQISTIPTDLIKTPVYKFWQVYVSKTRVTYVRAWSNKTPQLLKTPVH